MDLPTHTGERATGRVEMTHGGAGQQKIREDVRADLIERAGRRSAPLRLGQSRLGQRRSLDLGAPDGLGILRQHIHHRVAERGQDVCLNARDAIGKIDHAHGTSAHGRGTPPCGCLGIHPRRNHAGDLAQPARRFDDGHLEHELFVPCAQTIVGDDDAFLDDGRHVRALDAAGAPRVEGVREARENGVGVVDPALHRAIAHAHRGTEFGGHFTQRQVVA